jgi:hypothetical protein
VRELHLAEAETEERVEVPEVGPDGIAALNIGQNREPARVSRTFDIGPSTHEAEPVVVRVDVHVQLRKGRDGGLPRLRPAARSETERAPVAVSDA